MQLSNIRGIWFRFMVWQTKKMNHQTFLMIISVVIGILSGIAAVVLKNSVRFISELLVGGSSIYDVNFLYFALPAIGILLTILFVKYIIKDRVDHGVPSILYAISRNNGIIKKHNMFSSIVGSALTVGFGGSVGLEGPALATGAAVGSNLGQYLRLSYKDVILMMTLACAGAMAAIFKSPIAAIVFAVEVLMIDLTMTSLIPLLIASVTALLTSYFFLGNAVLYPFEITEAFHFHHIPYYILLGVITGMVSVYFTKMYVRVEKYFKKIEKWWVRWVSGGAVLGMLIFFFPIPLRGRLRGRQHMHERRLQPAFQRQPFLRVPGQHMDRFPAVHPGTFLQSRGNGHNFWSRRSGGDLCAFLVYGRLHRAVFRSSHKLYGADHTVGNQFCHGRHERDHCRGAACPADRHFPHCGDHRRVQPDRPANAGIDHQLCHDKDVCP